MVLYTFYKLWHPDSEWVYIGSTKLSIEKRIDRHRDDMGKKYNCASILILMEGEVYYDILFEYDCATKNIALFIERALLEIHPNACNTIYPLASIEDRRAKRRISHKNWTEECNICGRTMRKDQISRHQKSQLCQSKEKKQELLENPRNVSCDICGYVCDKYKLERHQSSYNCKEPVE